jgi:hypothetical protein
MTSMLDVPLLSLTKTMCPGYGAGVAAGAKVGIGVFVIVGLVEGGVDVGDGGGSKVGGGMVGGARVGSGAVGISASVSVGRAVSVLVGDGSVLGGRVDSSVGILNATGVFPGGGKIKGRLKTNTINMHVPMTIVATTAIVPITSALGICFCSSIPYSEPS